MGWEKTGGGGGRRSISIKKPEVLAWLQLPAPTLNLKLY